MTTIILIPDSELSDCSDPTTAKLIIRDPMKRSLPKFSKAQLTSTKILSQRSAVLAITPRATKKAPRQRRGPFNTIIDPRESGAGSAPVDVSEAVKESDKYDIWEEDIGMLDIKVRQTICSVHPEIECFRKGALHLTPPFLIELPAIPTPYQGTSYNPLADAHQALLCAVYEVEGEETKDAVKSRDAHLQWPEDVDCKQHA